MIFFLAIFGAPVAYLVVLLRLLIKGERRSLAWSLLFAAVAVMSAVWAMDQSRSSTAGLAFLGFPLMATVGGFLGLAFGRYRTSPDLARRIGAWLGLAGALALVGFNISGGLKEKTKNKGRDATQAAFSAEISRDRQVVDIGLGQNRGRERTWLDSTIRQHMTDHAFLLAALPHDSISPELLDTLASSTDLNIALETLRNPSTRGETLARIYHTASYPDYFFQAIAVHKNTPPDVLRDLFHRPRTITGLDIWFASNPSSPKEILSEIARTSTDKSVIGNLLGNPSIDCAILGQVGVNLVKVQHRDAEDPNVMSLSELLPTLCPQKPAL